MLKLTHSFYRSWGLKSQNICFDCKTYTYLIAKRKKCRSELTVKGLPIFNPVQLVSNNSGEKTNKKKKYQKRQKINEFDIKISEIMDDSLQPTTNNVSHGGNFVVSSTEHNAPSLLKSSDIGGSSTVDNHKCCIPLHFRIWEVVNWKHGNGDDPPFKFKIVSYNVLSQYLLTSHPYLYTDCSPHNLKWDVRWSKLFEEITNLDPDEVQASHLDSFYAKFKSIGYYGLFKKKTGDFYDGCAIYFKESKFHIIDHINVEYYQPELPVLNRHNVAIIVKLAPIMAPYSPFVVATTHLQYNPKRTDIRLAQTQVLLSEIDRFAYYRNGNEAGYMPIIMTGDFNSAPDSPVIRLLDKGNVSVGAYRDRNSDWRNIGVTDNCQHLSVLMDRERGDPRTDFSKVKLFNTEYSQSCEPKQLATSYQQFDHQAYFNSKYLSYPLKLTSVYNKFKHDNMLEATTYQDAWCTVDYIYYSTNNLTLLERLRLPTAIECEALGSLPNDVYGSDHLALAAVFELKPNKNF